MRHLELKKRLPTKDAINGLARHLGKRPTTVRTYLRGSTPDLSTCRDIATYVKMSLDELLYPEELAAFGVTKAETRVGA